jgi:hypothetical protein
LFNIKRKDYSRVPAIASVFEFYANVLNVMVEQFALLLCIWEVKGLFVTGSPKIFFMSFLSLFKQMQE